MAPRPREDELDVDGHRWHSPEYVADWIRAREEDSPEHRALSERRLDAILEVIPHDRRAAIVVLDLGAGWGRLARRLLEAFPNARLIAHDFSRPMREQARRQLADHADRLESADGDLEQPGVVSSLGHHFDVVVTSATLHHVSTVRLAHLYREIYQVLTPGGVFVNLDRVRRRAVALLQALAQRAPAGPVARSFDAMRGALGAHKDEGTHGGTLAQHKRMLTAAGFVTRSRRVGGWALMVGAKTPQPARR